MGEEYEIRVIDGTHFVYYKGEKLPAQISTIVAQDGEQAMNGFCNVTLNFNARLIDTKEQ